MADVKNEKRSDKAITDDENKQLWDLAICESLSRTQVYKQLPGHMRSKVDRVILLRPKRCSTLEAVAEQHQLEERYGISMKALRTYARKLEKLVRPAAASQVLAGVLGCLPESERKRMLAGSEVLLLSRVMQALCGDQQQALDVADLAKLSSILCSVAKNSGKPASEKKTGREPDRQNTRGNDNPAPQSPAKLAEAVHLLYGLNWPLPSGDNTES
jgi:hypothetical protein